MKITILASGFDSDVTDDNPTVIRNRPVRGGADKKTDRPDLTDAYGVPVRHPATKVPVMNPADYDNEEAIANAETPTTERVPRHGQIRRTRPLTQVKVQPATPSAKPAQPETAAEKPASPGNTGTVGKISFDDM